MSDQTPITSAELRDTMREELRELKSWAKAALEWMREASEDACGCGDYSTCTVCRQYRDFYFKLEAITGR